MSELVRGSRILGITSLFQTRAKAGDVICKRLRRCSVKKPDQGHCRLLSARRERPRHNGAADKCDKFPSPHGFAPAEDTIGYEKNITFLDLQ
jgi:hypothetical protein